MRNIVGYRPLAINYESLPPFNTKSLLFDGIDDYVDCGVITTLQSATQYSLSCWVKTTDITKTQGILKWFYTTTSWIELSFITGILYAIPTSISGYGTKALTGIISNDVWYNIIMVFDGTLTGNLNRLKVYINGIEIVLGYTGTVSAITSNITTDGFMIGERYINTDYFLGNIDEASIFNYALTSAEALAIGGTVPTDLSLLATPPTNWYRNGDNGSWKSPQWLIPNNENFAANKVSNYSFEFDGVNDYVDCGNDSSINISGDLTLSAWVKIPLSSNTFYGVFSKIDASTRNYELLIRNNETISFYTSNTEFTTSTSAIPLNTWTHVMVTVESGVAGGVKFYLNGVLDATTGTQTVVAQPHNLNIGRRSTDSFYLNGNIDEPCIFDRVVTPAEIVTLSTAPTVDLTSLNPVAWYRMGEDASFNGTNWTIPDSVGTNDGTSANMTTNDRVGDAPNSENNALSYNMIELDRVPETP